MKDKDSKFEEITAGYQSIKLPDHILEILDSYFEEYPKYWINNLISTWSGDEKSKNMKMYKKAITILHEAVNQEREAFLQHITEKYKEKYENLFQMLNVLSQECSGNMDKECNLFKDCRKLLSKDLFPDNQLKKEIGEFIKRESNKNLQEISPKLFETLHKDSKKELKTNSNAGNSF